MLAALPRGRGQTPRRARTPRPATPKPPPSHPQTRRAGIVASRDPVLPCATVIRPSTRPGAGRRPDAPGKAIARGVRTWAIAATCAIVPGLPSASAQDPPGIALAPSDASPIPGGDAPPVPRIPRAQGKPPKAASSFGWARALLEPPLRDARRRLPRTARPADFGRTLAVGERFRFDVTFAGNPAGLAEAEIVAIQADPRGDPPYGAPLIRIEGHARTSGIVSLLATVTDDMVSLADARTGATVWSENVIVYGGWSPTGYKRRVTTSAYEGRGQVRIVDVKDDKSRSQRKTTPIDTFDALGVMAWVRAQPLTPGAKIKAHVVDGTTLMRIEIEATSGKLERLPAIARAIEIVPNELVKITGTMTRVDPYDQPLPGKRVFTLRAWLSGDPRRIPVVMESDMWVGALRLELASYDPPRDDGDVAAR